MNGEEYNYFKDFLLGSGDLAAIADSLFMKESDDQSEANGHITLRDLLLAHIMLHLCRLNDKLDTLIERQQQS